MLLILCNDFQHKYIIAFIQAWMPDFSVLGMLSIVGIIYHGRLQVFAQFGAGKEAVFVSIGNIRMKCFNKLRPENAVIGHLLIGCA